MSLQGQFALAELIYKNKSCQVCQKKHRQANMILCDRCEDAYHTHCLNLKHIPEGTWTCNRCKADIDKIKQEETVKKKMANQSDCCARCELKVHEKKFEYNKLNEVYEVRQTEFIKCGYCDKNYHETCFSERQTSINCQICERQIRKSTPLGHNQHKKYVRMSRIRLAEELGFSQLLKAEQESNVQTMYRCNLIAPSPSKDWRIVTSYEASLYYALTTRKMLLSENLVCNINKQEIIIEANRSSIQKIYKLDPQDELQYENFKSGLFNGIYPPLTVRQDRLKGFYVTSTDLIPMNTILAQYVGEVMTARQSLNLITNDNIFTLIRNPRSCDSLDIAPFKVGNISIFFCGINNSDKSSIECENVKALKFQYNSHARVIFYASKDINPQETLYMNYNGDKATFEYPTNQFVK